MAAYLYTWNPTKWIWHDLTEATVQVNTDGHYVSPWSTSSRQMGVGDRFFLIRVGQKPKGIVGFGQVASEAYRAPHWDPSKPNDTEWKTDLLFRRLDADPILPLATLTEHFPSQTWTPFKGGIEIPERIAESLLDMLGESDRSASGPLEAEKLRRFLEGTPRTVTATTYDRSPEARRHCIEHHGAICAACGFDFGKRYGELGTGYIEVHHSHPVADIGEEYEIDPIADLRPVCANCHRMLHRRRPPLSIDELIHLIQRNRESKADGES